MPVDRLLARAKLNLSLQVEERNSAEPRKKLHNIKSSVVFLDLHDVLLLEEKNEGGVRLQVVDRQAEVSSVKIPSGEENLILRAARTLERVSKVSQNWHITLIKNIPVGAGLGGGSSDAAAFLLHAKKRLLLSSVRFASVRFAQKKWLDIAKEVGSDVAMFMLREKANNVCVEGTGDRVVSRGNLQACGVVLICGEGLATSEVYKRYALAQKLEAPRRGVSKSKKNRDEQYRTQEIVNMQNDLQDAACSLDARIGKRIEALRGCEGISCARMTGSGSACFGLTKSGEEKNTAERLKRMGFSDVIATSFLV